MIRRLEPVLAGIAGLVIIMAASDFRWTAAYNYLLLADAFNHGRVWIYWPGPAIDALLFHGRYYVIEAPFPAVLLMPFVAAFGGAVNQVWLAVLLGGIATGAAWELARRLGAGREATFWLVAFFLCGTDLWYCSMVGSVWMLAHVSAVCFTLLALVELAGKRRAWLVALYAVFAFESRFALILALPAYAYLALHGVDRARLRRQLVGFAAVLIPTAVLWVLYNEARWETWYDPGYTMWYHQDSVGSPTGSPFQLRYLPYQLYSFFVQAPYWVGQYPWLAYTMNGIALTWTSPPLILSFFARRPRPWVLAMWVAAILVAVPNFLYYVNGYAQFGMRHALDFEPFLFALMALAAVRGLALWARLLILFSIVVGAWGVWFWNVYYS